MIIQNYGLHWRRDRVNWGWQGRGGRGDLLGRPSSAARARSVNFREQAGIYVLHDGFRTVYVGQTGRGAQRLFTRLRGHTRNHLAERWDRFSWFGIYPVDHGGLETDMDPDRIRTNANSILDHLEGVLIAVTEPPLNRQGSRFRPAVQYAQARFTTVTDVEAADLEEEEEEEG